MGLGATIDVIQWRKLLIVEREKEREREREGLDGGRGNLRETDA